MPDLWCSFAERNAAPPSLWGGPLTPEKGVLHTTESRGGFRPGGSYFGHTGFPHFTVSRGKVWQHIPVNRACRALLNRPGGVETNNDGAVQIEIDWQAADIENLPDADMDALRRVMRWIERECKIPAVCGVTFHPYPPPVRLGREPWRLSFTEWDAYRGWCGHQHVPENDHGDPGLIDIAALLPPPTPAPVPPAEPQEFPTVDFIARYPDGAYRVAAAGRRRPLAPASLADKLKATGWPVVQLTASEVGGFEAAFPDALEG